VTVRADRSKVLDVAGNYPNRLRARLLLMKSLERPLPLKNAPLQYAPDVQMLSELQHYGHLPLYWR
jgi:hypothetical protein